MKAKITSFRENRQINVNAPNTARTGQVRAFAHTFEEAAPTADASRASGSFSRQIPRLPVTPAVSPLEYLKKGFMKSALSYVLLGFFLVSCVSNPQVSSPQPVTAVSPTFTAATTVTPVNLLKTVTPEIENTPTIAVPASISLSPIDVGNADQIQLLFTYHVAWDALSYGFVSISSNGKWVALAPKYGSPLSLLPLTWYTDHSIVPLIDVASSKTYNLRTEALAFSPDATYLAVAERDDLVEVFDLEHPEKNKTIHIVDWPNAVTFTKDSKKLIIGTKRGLEGYLQLWDVETATLEQEISRNAPSGGICSVAISPDGKILAAGYCTYVFDSSTWDIEKGFIPITRLAGLDEVLYCAHFCTDDRNIIVFNPSTGDIASGTNHGRIPIQNPRSGKLTATISTWGRDEIGNYDAGPTNALAFTANGSVLVIATSTELQIRDVKDGRLLWSHEPDGDARGMSAVTITADSRLLISVNSNGDVEFWGIPDK